MHAQNKLPILVGGTHYYIQALLWHQQLIAADEAIGQSSCLNPHSSLDQIVKEELHDLLGKSDPRSENYVYTADLAQKLHTLLSRLDPGMIVKSHN